MFYLPRFLRNFLNMESAGGVVMLGVAALAMLLANSPLAESYSALTDPLHFWVNDVLMVLFFLLVGLELKRELREGFLTQRAQILLPLAAAIGGMAVPAFLFYLCNQSDPTHVAGWAIPSATDIAFALCVLMLAGKSLPSSAKIFLLAIAIFDDLGAILIIALVYNTGLALVPLLLSLLTLTALYLLNTRGVTSRWMYGLLGIALWFALHEAGIHTTLAGVAVGLAIPMRHGAHSPVQQSIHHLHPWVSFLILPVFAFTSAGVNFTGVGLHDFFGSLPSGIALGLFFGKQIGIFGISWLLVKLQLVSLPVGLNWLRVYGISVIAGIGFTMSLFISLLAFADPKLQSLAKIGIIAGSLLSALWGVVVLRLAARRA